MPLQEYLPFDIQWRSGPGKFENCSITVNRKQNILANANINTDAFLQEFVYIHAIMIMNKIA